MDMNDLTNTNDYTNQISPADIQENKAMGILAYIGFLVFIPMLAAPQSQFARFHVSQGLTLFIIEFVAGVLGGLLSLIPFIGWIFGICFGAAGAVGVILSIIGIVNAAQGQAKEIPLTGKIRFIK